MDQNSFAWGLCVCNCSWKEAKTTYEIIQGCALTSVDFRQGCQLPYLSIMNVISLLVFYVLKMLYLSCKSFWPILWCLFWQWEMKVLWCLHPSTAEEFSSSIMAEVSYVVSVSPSLHEELRMVGFVLVVFDLWLCILDSEPLEKWFLDPCSVTREKVSCGPKKWCCWLSLYWAFRQTFRCVRFGLLNHLEIK